VIDQNDTVETPRELVVSPWMDSAATENGHRPGSPYVEAVWLGVIGPSATWAWQRLARLAEVRPGARIDSLDLAVSLGLGERLSRNASLSRTLRRLEGFEVVRRDDDVLAVRVRLPDVPDRRLWRLSPSARAAHERFSLRAHQIGGSASTAISSALVI
jgi:hypothetical protein